MIRAAALRAIAARVHARKSELARQIVDRFRNDIVGFRLEEGESEYERATGFALRSIEALLSGLAGAEPISESFLNETADTARSLMRHGVSMDAMDHAIRVWGSMVWDAVIAAADSERPDELEAALWIGGRLWTHVDLVSSAMANAYVDEITDRGLMRRELLDGLLAGRGSTEYVRRLARSLHIRLMPDYVVLLVRGDGVPVEEAPERPLATRLALDHIAEAARRRLRPTSGSPLVGIRNGDLVALYSVDGPLGLDSAKRDAAALAEAVPVDVSIGLSGWHPGPAGIATAYQEAREAVQIAAAVGVRGRAVTLEDVLVDHLLRCSPHAQRLLEGLISPLLTYDAAHHAELVETLRAYIDAGTNLARSSRRLTVHPNTVVYRLRRIRELTGRDPYDMSELLVLFLALRLRELSALDAFA